MPRHAEPLGAGGETAVFRLRPSVAEGALHEPAPGHLFRPDLVADQAARQVDRPDPLRAQTVGEIGRTCTQSYGVFPNWVSPLSHRALPPLLFWPNGIDKCRLETWTMVHDWGDGPRPELQDMWTTPDGSELGAVLQEDTQFGDWIQKSMQSYGFKGVPLSYQEMRIYHWNQSADRMIGIDNIPAELRVAQVIGEEWIYPNDPRLAEMNEELGQSAG